MPEYENFLPTFGGTLWFPPAEKNATKTFCRTGFLADIWHATLPFPTARADI